MVEKEWRGAECAADMPSPHLLMRFTVAQMSASMTVDGIVLTKPKSCERSAGAGHGGWVKNRRHTFPVDDATSRHELAAPGYNAKKC